MRGRASCFIRLVPALVVGASALVFAAPGASAATGTAATFTLNGGGLAITQPTTATIGSAFTGATSLAGTLGTVTVQDQRGNLTATWTASVTSTDFTTGGASTYETVKAASIAYNAGTATASTGVGTYTPGVLTGLSNTVAGTAASWTGTGNNSASWNPTLTFTLSASQVAGTYTGTITHSVA